MRIRPLLPLLLTTVAVPAVAGDYRLCTTAPDFVSCLIEQDEFARQRNAEIDASIARVERARAAGNLASASSCMTRYSRSARCIAERFAAHQNGLAAASITRVAEVRAFEAARNAEVANSVARVAARRARRLEAEQNALVEASLAAVEIERERRFAAYQNELATASVERVAAEQRRELAAHLSACASTADTRPRCLAEQAREFAAQQNQLAALSVQRVETERTRAFAAARNAEINASVAAVVAARQRDRQLAAAGNGQIETGSTCQSYNWLTAGCKTETSSQQRPTAQTSNDYAAYTSHCVRNPDSPRCDVERIREFAAARNTEINASLAAVERARAQRNQEADYAAYTSHCVRDPESPRCEAERIREFAAARNAEINASLAAVQRARTERGQQSDYAAYTSNCVRNPDSQGCDADNIREFAAARNAEIERSIAAVAAARAKGLLSSNPALRNDTTPLETGTIGAPSLPQLRGSENVAPEGILRRDISADPCRAVRPEPVQFSRGAYIESGVKPGLDRLAKLARSCPGMRIEVHGYADSVSHFSNGHLSQARAQAIASYLIAAGVSANRVTTLASSARNSGAAGDGFTPVYGDRAELVVKNPSTDAAARRVMWDLAELLDPAYIPAVANLSP